MMGSLPVEQSVAEDPRLEKAPANARHYAALLICGLLGVVGVLQILGDGGVIGWLLAGFLLLGARFYFSARPGEWKLLARCLAALAAFVAVLVAGLFIAWESAEVVVLRYSDDQGKRVEARLWVIDLEGHPSVAMGSGKSRVAWIQANPDVELVRGERVECRRAVVISESAATPEGKRTAERLFAEKYGLRLHATRALRFVFGAPPGEEPVLIRLEPCP